MPWKQRRGASFFYVNQRVGSRVVSAYVGRGPDALLIAEQLRQDQLRRAEERERRRTERGQLDAAAAASRALDDVADLATKAVLVTAGYHQHHRCEWRRRRGSKTYAGQQSQSGEEGDG